MEELHDWYPIDLIEPSNQQFKLPVARCRHCSLSVGEVRDGEKEREETYLYWGCGLGIEECFEVHEGVELDIVGKSGGGEVEGEDGGGEEEEKVVAVGLGGEA